MGHLYTNGCIGLHLGIVQRCPIYFTTKLLVLKTWTIAPSTRSIPARSSLNIQELLALIYLYIFSLLLTSFIKYASFLWPLVLVPVSAHDISYEFFSLPASSSLLYRHCYHETGEDVYHSEHIHRPIRIQQQDLIRSKCSLSKLSRTTGKPSGNAGHLWRVHIATYGEWCYEISYSLSHLMQKGKLLSTPEIPVLPFVLPVVNHRLI